MSDTRELLQRILCVMEILSATEFSWFGRRSEQLKPEIARLLSEEEARRFLVQQIRERLYDSFYSVGIPRPADETMNRTDASDTRFVQKLQQANHGTGAWLNGWTVIDATDSHVRVQGEELRLTVPRSRCRETGPQTNFARLSSGSRVEVQFPCEQLAISPGYYVAQGNEPFASDRSRQLIRIYFNATPSAATLLMNHFTTELNQHMIPFEFKVLKSLALSNRCDGAVLYINREHLEVVWAGIENIDDKLAEHLRTEVPAFTKRMAPGIGGAENPIQGGSFGDHRCAILAEGLVRAYERRADRPKEKLAIVIQTFAEAGIDLDAPFINPTSEVTFPTSHRVDQSDSLTVTRPNVNDMPKAFVLKENESTCRSTWLEASEAVARQLVARTIQFGDRCTWVAPLPAAPNATRHIISTLDASVYQGTSGVALFLADVAAATQNTAYAIVARRAMRQAFANLNTLCPKFSFGLYSGRLGVAWAGVEVGERLADHSLTEQAIRCVRDLARQPLGESEFDIMGGLAGGILALLAIDRRIGGHECRDLAVRLGNQLASQATRHDTSLSWRSRTLRAQRDLTGYSHGAAGVGHAMADLAALTGETKFSRMAEGAFAYERQCFDFKHANWPDFRPDPQRVVGSTNAFGCSWCHGAPGIGLSRLAADAHIDSKTESRQDALTALTTTRDWLHEWLQRADDESPCLCHGFLGNADVVIAAQKHEWASHPEDLQLLQRVADAAITRCLPDETSWSKCAAVQRDPSLMVGFAGVGHFFLRMAGAESVTAV